MEPRGEEAVGATVAIGADVQDTRGPRATAPARPTVRGKFLFTGDEKFFCRGTSYGTFRIGPDGREELDPKVVDADFAAMERTGFNVVRVNTAPPRWLLDTAGRHRLRVFVVLSWGESMALLAERGAPARIERSLREQVRALAGHPALLGYAVGNEIPASIARWQGRRTVERFVYRLYRAAKEEDPGALVSYVNYPSTEYLRLPFLDFVCFNVYLEESSAFERYLARLHSLSGDRPLLLTEIGLDSRRAGEARQASLLSEQVRSAVRSGVAGVVVFAWTDEWYHGQHRVEDWAFGLTRADRTPKPALAAVAEAFAAGFGGADTSWPPISVVVCSYNGAATLAETLGAIGRLDYPVFETIVVDDGSSDGTAGVALRFPARLVRSEHRGLGAARNVGWQEARGPIVAYLDDDAYPDRDWLRFLALALRPASVVGAGGPNLPPAGDGRVAAAVACAPGGPNPVLLTDDRAEHLAGCNMAFRREALERIGGFDPVFRSAGDDVDVGWRLLASGGELAYAPAAVVWHHRRPTVRRYLRQQAGYGRAEALLERKWPDRFDRHRKVLWRGRVYGPGVSADLGRARSRVYHGTWGLAPFQTLYEPSWSTWSVLATPEWYLGLGCGLGLVALNLTWFGAVPLGIAVGAGAALTVGQAGYNAYRGRARTAHLPSADRPSRGTVLVLHLLQPAARLSGRLRGGLRPWRRRPARFRLRSEELRLWRDERKEPAELLGETLRRLRSSGVPVEMAGPFDAWDLEAPGGAFGGCRVALGVEEHAPGKQLLRFRLRPKFYVAAIGGGTLALALAAGAAAASDWFSAAAMGSVAALVAYGTGREVGGAQQVVREAVSGLGESAPQPRGRLRSRPSLSFRTAATQGAVQDP